MLIKVNFISLDKYLVHIQKNVWRLLDLSGELNFDSVGL